MKQLVKVVDLEDQRGPKIEPKPERAEMTKDFLNLPNLAIQTVVLDKFKKQK